MLKTNICICIIYLKKTEQNHLKPEFEKTLYGNELWLF